MNISEFTYYSHYTFLNIFGYVGNSFIADTKYIINISNHLIGGVFLQKDGETEIYQEWYLSPDMFNLVLNEIKEPEFIKLK